MIICFLKVKGEIIQECYCNFIDSVFGEDLSEEIGKSNTETPWVIIFLKFSYSSNIGLNNFILL
jgi:hypothetical protein